MYSLSYIVDFKSTRYCSIGCPHPPFRWEWWPPRPQSIGISTCPIQLHHRQLWPLHKYKYTRVFLLQNLLVTLWNGNWTKNIVQINARGSLATLLTPLLRKVGSQSLVTWSSLSWNIPKKHVSSLFLKDVTVRKNLLIAHTSIALIQGASNDRTKQRFASGSRRIPMYNSRPFFHHRWERRKEKLHY